MRTRQLASSSKKSLGKRSPNDQKTSSSSTIRQTSCSRS